MNAVVQTLTNQKVTKEAVNITVEGLAKVLKEITKSTVCNVIYLVDDSRSRTIKGEKQVQKLVNITHVYLNHDYTNKVNNLNGTDNFVAQPLKGKTRICSTLLKSDKTGAFMIDGKVLKSEASKVLGYFHKGDNITEKEAEFMQLWANSYYNPKPKTTMGRGSVNAEDDFRIINTYLTRIKAIKLAGQWYNVL